MIATPRSVSPGQFEGISFNENLTETFQSLFGMGGIKEKNLERIKTKPMSLAGVVQASSMFGVVVFAKHDPDTQANGELLVEVAGKLASFKDQESSTDPLVAHVQNRLWSEGDLFGTEPVDPAFTGGNRHIYWCAESLSGAIPEDFDSSKDALITFYTESDGQTFLKFVDKGFYAKNLY